MAYHWAWMDADLGVSVVAADLESQANLTSMFIEQRKLEELLKPDPSRNTLHGALMPLRRGSGLLSNLCVTVAEWRVIRSRVGGEAPLQSVIVQHQTATSCDDQRQR